MSLVIETTSTMPFLHKIQEFQRHTAVLQEQAKQAATALRARNRTEMLNNAVHRHRAILRRHLIARSSAHSITIARRVAHAAL